MVFLIFIRAIPFLYIIYFNQNIKIYLSATFEKIFTHELEPSWIIKNKMSSHSLRPNLSLVE